MKISQAPAGIITVLRLYACVLVQEPLQPGLSDAYQQLTALYAEVLGSVTASASFPDDVLYRFLVGLGTLLTVRERRIDHTAVPGGVLFVRLFAALSFVLYCRFPCSFFPFVLSVGRFFPCFERGILLLSYAVLRSRSRRASE